jgi:HPr kinase/phosphorylase
LRPTPIALVTETELEWIYSQTEQSLYNSPAFDFEEVSLIVLCANCNPNPAVISVCTEKSIALVRTRLTSNDALDYFHSHLPKIIALRGVQHGVFLAVMNVGVLITGASGVGKSEVAMDLVQRGHQLIADDAVDIYRGEQSELIGECPEPLKGHIEIRGLGIISILKMFGPSSVLDSNRLQLVIDLKDASNSEIQKVDRLAPSLKDWEFLGIKVPCLTMLVAPGRNLSVLVEAAVRDHLLRISGIDSSADFISVHDKSLGILQDG